MASIITAGTTTGTALSLTSDTSGELQIKTNNGSTTALTLTTGGAATFTAGTVSAPAITTSGDTNTGIFFPAADTIAFTEGGTESMRIDSSGNVGIGTSSPVSIAGYTIQTLNNGTSGSGTYYQQAATSIGRVLVTSTEMYVGSNGAYPLILTTNAAERMRIDSSGNVGIGTSSPTGKFNVTGSVGSFYVDAGATGIAFTYNGGNYISAKGGSSGALVFETGGANERMRIDSSGNVNVNTAGVYLRINAASTTFDISGQAGATDFLRINANGTQRYQFNSAGQAYNSTGTWGTISDARLKENIVDATSKLDKVNKLRVVNFNLKSDPDVKQIGFIAQEMEEVFPSLVQEGEEDGEGGYFKAVKTTVLIPILVKAIQELKAEVDALKAQVENK